MKVYTMFLRRVGISFMSHMFSTQTFHLLATCFYCLLVGGEKKFAHQLWAFWASVKSSQQSYINVFSDFHIAKYMLLSNGVTCFSKTVFVTTINQVVSCTQVSPRTTGLGCDRVITKCTHHTCRNVHFIPRCLYQPNGAAKFTSSTLSGR